MTTPPLDDAALDELQRLWEASTADWRDSDDGDCTHPVIIDADFGVHRVVNEPDYQFAIVAHSQIPAILSRIRNDAEKIRRLRDALEQSVPEERFPGNYFVPKRWQRTEIDCIEKGESHA